MKFLFIATAILFIFSSSSILAQENTEKNTEKKSKRKYKIVTIDENGEKIIIDSTILDDADFKGLGLDKDIEIVRKMKDDDTCTARKGKVIALKNKNGKYHKAHKFRIKNGHETVMDDAIAAFKSSDCEKEYSIVELQKECGHKMKKIHLSVDKDIEGLEDGCLKKKCSKSKGGKSKCGKSKGGKSKGGKSKCGKSKGTTYHNRINDDDNDEDELVWLEEENELDDGESHIIIKSKSRVEEFVVDGDTVIRIKDGKVEMEGKEKNKEAKEVKMQKVIKKAKNNKR